MKGVIKIPISIVTITVLLTLVITVYSQSQSLLPQDGLVNYWKLEGNAKDSAGSLNGVVTGALPETNGLFGQAYKFDGDKDYIFLGNHTTEEDKYTVSAWFKTDSTTWQTIFHRGHSSACFYNPKIDIKDGRVIVSESDCKSDGRIGGRYYPGIPFKLGEEWNHVVVTRNGNVAKVYLNGYLQITDFAQPGSPETLKKDDGKVVIGASRGKKQINNTNAYLYFLNSFNGLIDDVAVWDRPLTEQEVESIYKQAFPNAKPPVKPEITYQQVETFPTNKPTFNDKYVGDSSWTVESGHWFVNDNILKKTDGGVPGDIITLDSIQSTPGKSIRVRVRQEGGNWHYSVINMGRQDINNTYYVVLDPSSKNIFLRRVVDGVADSIGLEVDFVYKKWYDVEFRWISPKELQVEVWDESGDSLGTLTRDSIFDYSVSENWISGKFGLAGVKGNKVTWFDNVRIGTIKDVVEPSPSPTPSPTPTGTESPSPSPSPSPTQPPENDFDLTITGSSEINEGENARMEITGRYPTQNAEAYTDYYILYDTKDKQVTENNFHDQKTAFGSDDKVSVAPLYKDPRTYKISVLAVSSPTEKKTARAEHILTVKNIPPVANAGINKTVTQGQAVPFNGDGSHAGPYDNLFFYWDVDASDGLSFEPNVNNSDLEGAAPQTYSYSQTGTYIVTLRVFDDDGTYDDDTVQITVLESIQSPSPSPSPTPTEPAEPPTQSQFKLPLKTNDLDDMSKVWKVDTNFLLNTVKDSYQQLDRQDIKFLFNLPSEILERLIQKENGVDDGLTEVLVTAFQKDAREDLQTGIVGSMEFLNSEKSVDLISELLNAKLLGRCVKSSSPTSIIETVSETQSSEIAWDKGSAFTQKGPSEGGGVSIQSESITNDLKDGKTIDIYLDNSINSQHGVDVNVELYSPPNPAVAGLVTGLGERILSRHLVPGDGNLKIKERIRIKTAANGYGIEVYDSNNKRIKCVGCDNNRVYNLLSNNLPLYVLIKYSGADRPDFELQTNINSAKFSSLQEAEDNEPPKTYQEVVCDKAEEVAVKKGDSRLLGLLDLIGFVESTSNKEVFVESVNICNTQDNICHTQQPTLAGYIVEAKIKNLGSDRQFHTTTKILNPTGGELLVRSTKGDPEKIELKSGESKWIAVTDQNHLLNKKSKDQVNIKLEIRDYSGYRNLITGTYEVGSKKEFEIPQKYNFTNYGISVLNSGQHLIESNVIIPLMAIESSIYLESSSNNEIYQNQIVPVGSGHGILLTDGSPPSNNNKLKSNKIGAVGKKSNALYIRGSQNITSLNDVLSSADASDLRLERSREIRLVNTTFRKNRTSFYLDNQVDVGDFLNIVVKDSETGDQLKDVSLKVVNNKDKQEVLKEKISAGEKKGMEIVKRKIKTSKGLKTANLESFHVKGPRLYFDDNDTTVEEESLEYLVTAEVPGYKQGSAIVKSDSKNYIELSLEKETQEVKDPEAEPIPPPPASNPSPPSTGGSTGSGISYVVPKVADVAKISSKLNIRTAPDTIKLAATEGKSTQINQVISVENTGSSPLKVNLKVEGLSQLSLDNSEADLDAKEEKQLFLKGEVKDLKTGTYPGKILITSSGIEESKEIPIVLTVNPVEHLFDLVLDLATNSTAVFAGDDIQIRTKIVNIAGGKFEAKVTYGLKDLANNILIEEDQIVSGEAVTELIKKIKTDPNYQSGNYIVEALLKDQSNENVAVSALTIYINGKTIAKSKTTDLPLNIILPIIIVIVVALVATKFVIRRKK